MGGEILGGFDVTGVEAREGRIVSVTAQDANSNSRQFTGDYFFSTTSVQELVRGMGDAVPANLRAISEGLQYRDFITVGLLLKKLKLREPGDTSGKLISDNWIYIQEPDVLVGRLQIFNNWSPYLVADSTKVWLGAEYFCYQDDELWRKSDDELTRFAVEELEKIQVIEKADVVDSAVARMPKAYPAYFGSYARFPELREYLDKFENLFLVGRNGMHKYNNQDHSMLTAMTAVDNLVDGITDKSNIWAVNTEDDYLEAKSSVQALAAKNA
jgi:protoporphyrinogen oxidase